MYYKPITVKKAVSNRRTRNTGNVKLKKKKKNFTKKDGVLDNACFDILI